MKIFNIMNVLLYEDETTTIKTTVENAVSKRINLVGANLTEANLTKANLTEACGLIKLIGVELGNVYWKRFEDGLNNNGFQFFKCC